MTSAGAVSPARTEPNPWRNRLSFGLGTLGRDMTSALVSMYLMFYLTDVLHIGPELVVGVTVAMVALRIFDALNDPVMGVIVDNTRSRWGKFKPWIALGALLASVTTVWLFVDTGVRGSAFVALFTLSYLAWGVSYTINDISFYGMLPALSRDQKERERIGVVARITANVGLFAVVVGVLPVTRLLGDALGNPQRGWLAFAVIVVVVMLAFQSLTLLFTRERVAAPRQQTPLRELVGVIVRNDQLLWTTVAMLLFMSGYMATTSLGIYYFKYILGDEGLYPVFAAVLAVAQLSGLAVFPLLSRRLRRREIHLLASVLCVAGLVVFAFAGASLAVVAVAGVLLFVGQAFIQLLMLMFIADCVEYGQWKLGRRNESVTISLQPFIYKSSNAIGNGLVGAAIVWSGIAGATSAADITPAGAWAFRAVMMGLPIVLITLSWVILRARYRIDEDFYARIVADLRLRDLGPLPRRPRSPWRIRSTSNRSPTVNANMGRRLARVNDATSPWSDLDAYIAVPRLTGLALSHDGATLVCSVQAPDAEATAYATSLWRIDVAGGPARRLTRSVEGEAAAAFLRDGSLVFTSKRDLPPVGAEPAKETEAALWRLPADGGEAHVFARRDGGWGQVLTAADADVLVAGVPVHTGAVDDEADATLRERRRKQKVTAIWHDGYPVRFWDKDLGPETTRLRTGAVVPGADGDPSLSDPRDLTGDVGRAVGATALSRDGRLLVAEWNVAGPGGETITQLAAFDVATGSRRVLAADTEAEFGDPVISDDGAVVACQRTMKSTPEQAPLVSLWLIDVATGEGRALAAGWDRWPQPVAFSPDGATLYAVADEDGASPVLAVDVATGAVRRLTGGGAHTSVLRSPDGTTLYALRTSYAEPGSVVAIDVASATSRVLNAPVEYPPLPGRIERVETTAADGARIPGWLVLPEGASAESPVPLTLWVHGGPLGSWNAWSWRWCPWLLASRGQAVLLPDPALSTGYGQAFIQRGWGRWGAEPFADVMALTDAVEARADIRDDASTMMGGSFGGYMANWIATQTSRFKAIVTHASLWNLTSFGPTTDASWYWARELSPEMMEAYSPHNFADNIVTPMLVIHGDRDYRVPIGEGLALWWALASRHDGDPATLPHRFLYFPDENHWILTPNHAKVWYSAVLEFLDANRAGRLVARPDLL